MNRKTINRKLALILRSREEGFALPITLGLGLIMILIAATLIVRAQGDQTTASAQKATNQGLSAAETGITRYQALINSNRAIATYKDCEGTRNTTSGACPDTGTTKSWTNATAIPGITSCSGGSSSSVIDKAGIAWRDVDTNDSSLGQYRLVSYVYSSTVGTAPGTGQLTVEGRVNQSGSGSTATKGVSTATTRLKVDIPVGQTDFRTIAVPGLWFKVGTLGPHVGNGNTVNGNVLYTGGCNPVDIGGTINGSRTAALGLSLPDLPTPPASFPASNTLGSITSALTLPRITDIPVEEIINGYKQRVYKYKVSSINLGQNGDTITITPGKRVSFYVEGNINTSGQGKFIHTCAGYTSLGPLTPVSTTTTFPIPLTTSANTLNEACKPSNVQIFAYGRTGLTGAAISSPEICLNGNGFLEAFILGPTYKAGVAGAGASGGFKGSVWVNEWSSGSGCGSNTSNVVIEQTTNWDELAPLGLTIKDLPPTIASVSSWQRQETP